MTSSQNPTRVAIAIVTLVAVILVAPTGEALVYDPLFYVWNVERDVVRAPEASVWAAARVAGMQETEISRLATDGGWHRPMVALPHGDGMIVSQVSLGTDGSFGTEVALIDGAGQAAWSRFVSHSEVDFGSGAALAPNGDIIIASAANAASGPALAIDRLDGGTGVTLWTTEVPMPYGGLYDFTPVAVDRAGNIFALETRDEQLSSSCPSDVYQTTMVKLDASGSLLWSEVLPYPEDCYFAHHLGITPAGDVLVAGGAEVSSSQMPSTLYLFGADGHLLRAATLDWGELGGLFSYDMQIADNGAVWLSGGMWSASGASSAPPNTGFLLQVVTGKSMGIVAKLTPDLSVSWVRAVDAGFETDLGSMALARDGGVFVGGFVRGWGAYSGTPLTSSPLAPLGQDAIVARIADDGAVLWVRALPASTDSFQYATASRVALSADGSSIWTAGEVQTPDAGTPLFVTKGPATSAFAPVTGTLATAVGAAWL